MKMPFSYAGKRKYKERSTVQMREMDHQDWKQVVFKARGGVSLPKDPLQPPRSTHTATASTTSSKPAWKIEQQVDDVTGGSKPLTFVSADDARKVVAGRVARKLTQKELATRINVQLKDIQEIENGKAVENRQLLAKIRKVLGVAA